MIFNFETSCLVNSHLCLMKCELRQDTALILNLVNYYLMSALGHKADIGSFLIILTQLSRQRVPPRPRNQHGHDLSHQLFWAVKMGALEIRTSAKELSVLAATIFDKDIERASDEGFIKGHLLCVEQILETFEPLRFYVFWHLARHGGAGGSGTD